MIEHMGYKLNRMKIWSVHWKKNKELSIVYKKWKVDRYVNDDIYNQQILNDVS